MYNSRITSMTTLQMVSMGIVMKEMTASAKVRWNTRKCTFVRLTRSTLQSIILVEVLKEKDFKLVFKN